MQEFDIYIASPVRIFGNERNVKRMIASLLDGWCVLGLGHEFVKERLIKSQSIVVQK